MTNIDFLVRYPRLSNPTVARQVSKHVTMHLDIHTLNIITPFNGNYTSVFAVTKCWKLEATKEMKSGHTCDFYSVDIYPY